MNIIATCLMLLLVGWVLILVSLYLLGGVPIELWDRWVMRRRPETIAQRDFREQVERHQQHPYLNQVAHIDLYQLSQYLNQLALDERDRRRQVESWSRLRELWRRLNAPN
jgi:hypothetical protein